MWNIHILYIKFICMCKARWIDLKTWLDLVMRVRDKTWSKHHSHAVRAAAPLSSIMHLSLSTLSTSLYHVPHVIMGRALWGRASDSQVLLGSKEGAPGYRTECDMWAVGVIAYSLLCCQVHIHQGQSACACACVRLCACMSSIQPCACMSSVQRWTLVCVFNLSIRLFVCRVLNQVPILNRMSSIESGS